MASKSVFPLFEHPRVVPPGRPAIHRDFGWVDVVARDGELRKIRRFEHESRDYGPETGQAHEDPDVLFEETLVQWEEWVSYTTLRAVRHGVDAVPSFWKNGALMSMTRRGKLIEVGKICLDPTGIME